MTPFLLTKIGATLFIALILLVLGAHFTEEGGMWRERWEMVIGALFILCVLSLAGAGVGLVWQ